MASHKETICVHHHRDDQGVNTPIYVSSSNKYIGYDENIYPRYFNTENQAVIVQKLCELEKTEAGLIFSSGMAAISTTLLSLLKPNDHILLSREIYGGTHKLALEEFSKFGIEYDFVSNQEIESLENKIKPNTRLIYTETPSNPLLSVIDLKMIAEFAQARQLISVVDNTFATPINQRPIELGIDVVLHSGTKYLGGHSDLCFGAMLSSQAIQQRVYQSALSFGGSLNALDCYLIERSLKTLAVRVDKHNQNALQIAEFLNQQGEVAQVFYPGLSAHPGHEVAKAQMNGAYGGMLAFELTQPDKTEAFLRSLQLITPSLSLGGVETIICQPSKTSHIKVPEADRLKLGITDGLLRLSVGIEHAEDLMHDLKVALEKAVRLEAKV